MEEKEEKHSFKDLMKVAFAAFLKSYRLEKVLVFWFVVIGIFAGVAPYIASGTQALLLNHLGEIFGKGSFVRETWLLIILAGAVYIFRDMLENFHTRVEKKIWFRLNAEYENEFSEKMTSLDMAVHEDPKFKDKIQAMQERGGTYAVTDLFESSIGTLRNVVGVTSASWIMLFVDWKIFLLVVVACVPLLWIEVKHGNTIWSIHMAKSEQRRKYQEIKRHTMWAGNIRELQTFQTIPFFISRLRKMLTDFYDTQMVEEQKRILKTFLSDLLMALAIVVSLVILVTKVISGGMQVGTFVFTFSAVTGLSGSLSSFFRQIGHMYQKHHTVQAFFEIMNTRPIIFSKPKSRKLNLSKAPTIEFQDVSFRYPQSSGKDKEVLKNFSLKIESGEKLALVGVNGAGKSTIMKLLFRFYDPTEGKILINGIDLKDLNLDEWYGYLALLSQDFATYKFKVWELISLGKLSDKRHQRKIEKASVRSSSDEFIKKWEQRFEQQIGIDFEGGVEPSHGQRQKLALARSIYRDAFVTILDEPTASIDAKAEKEIFENIEENIRDEQTLILVSHRFSTVRKADKICVIEDGAVREHGTHEELLALGGIYAGLFTSQAEGYK